MNWPERVWIYSPLRALFQKREVRKWIRIGLPPNRSIALEIGCGLGRGARLISDYMGFQDVIAFDLETKLVRRSLSGSKKIPGMNLHFLTADAQDLPFPDQSFDAVFNFGIIHHVLDWRRCLAEIQRVMKPMAMFYFEEIYPPLYANWLLKRMLRHPKEDRFYESDFLGQLSHLGMRIREGTKTGSRFGVIGAAQKRSET
ncbi:MAG: class I SAM-dependent methyltransferase [Pseudomonadota bacterium]